MNGEATETEMKDLLVWLRNKENRVFFHKITLDKKNSLNSDSFTAESRESWMLIQERIAQKSYGNYRQILRINQILKYAAIFLLLITISGIFLFLKNRDKTVNETFSTIYAENGQISKVELPDGSMVWLNSGSKIIYNNHFATKNRKVILKGEAFFDVKKGMEIPFLVSSNEITVKVHGTRFNILENQSSSKIEVVLEEGKIELFNGNNESSLCILNPGELATINRQNRKLIISKVNTERHTSWKEGILNIYNQPLKEVVKLLENRYNQPFEYENEAAELLYTFTIKNESLEDILQLMESITPVSAHQKGNIIHIKKDKIRKRKIS